MLIFSRPLPAPPVPFEAFSPYQLTWTGWDGSVWNLSDWESGLFLDNRGIEGLHFPVLTKFSSTSRAVPGLRRRGWRAEERKVFWPLQVYAESSKEWLASYRSFFKTIRPDQEGVWSCTVDGQTRTLRLTGTFTDSHAYEIDPLYEGWSPFGVRLEAAQPYWEGSPVTRGPWKGADPMDFYGESGAPDFHISSSATIGNASMTNPGDVAAYPVWTIDGELDDIAVGVGDLLIEPADVDAGKRLVIDTDPRNATALLGDIPADGEEFEGVDVTQSLGFQRFSPIPPGQSVPLHVEGIGDGSVSCTLKPLYFTAF